MDFPNFLGLNNQQNALCHFGSLSLFKFGVVCQLSIDVSITMWYLLLDEVFHLKFNVDLLLPQRLQTDVVVRVLKLENFADAKLEFFLSRSFWKEDEESQSAINLYFIVVLQFHCHLVLGLSFL